VGAFAAGCGEASAYLGVVRAGFGEGFGEFVVVFGRAVSSDRCALRFQAMVLQTAAVVARDAVLDLAAEALHAGEEFLLRTFVPLFQGRPLGVLDSSLRQEFCFVHVLGGFHERGVLEVRVVGTVDVRGGFLPQPVKVGAVDAVLTDEEQAFLHGDVRCFQSNATDRISKLADVFLAELERSDKASRTKDKYAFSVKKYISPGIGSVRIGETTPGVVDHFIRNVVDAAGPATARTCGAVLSWMFKIALRHDAVSINPVLGISIPRSQAAKPQALDPVQFLDLRTKLINWEQGSVLGRTRSQELHQIADFLINTGLRAGELFALSWADIDLDADPPTVHVHATVIRTSTGGVTNQDHPKSEYGIRYVTIPPNLAASLRSRRGRQINSATANRLYLVFSVIHGDGV
jgi:integrase